MNKEITVYELLGLIKDNKAPKKILYNNVVWEYNDYHRDYQSRGNAEFLFNDEINPKWMLDHLNTTIEILDKENDEFEDIEIMTLEGEEIGYGIMKRWLDFTPNENEQKICSAIEAIGIEFNKVIRNQKKIIEKIENKGYMFESIDELNNYINERLNNDEIN